MITYEPLRNTLQRRNMSWYAMIHHHDFSSNTCQRIRNNEGVTTGTLDKLCQILQCDICDIIAYVPDQKTNYTAGGAK